MKRILIAGIGNIFLGDDAFGVEVVHEFQGRTLPTEVQAKGDPAKIKAIAEDTKKHCPVSKVLRAQIDLEVKAG